MESKEQKVHNYLKKHSINYQKYKHKAVYTVEEAKQIDAKIPGAHTKNLFLKNEKSQDYFLVVILAKKRANLKQLANIFKVKRLTFGKPDMLEQYLSLNPGSVSPFGLINDLNSEIVVLLDKDLFSYDTVNFHPNVNTSTLNLKIGEFEKYLNTLKQKVLKEVL